MYTGNCKGIVCWGSAEAIWVGAQSRSSGGWSSLQLSRESSMRSRSGFSSVDSDGLSRPVSGAAADDGCCFECGDVIDTRVMLVDSFKVRPMAQ